MRKRTRTWVAGAAGLWLLGASAGVVPAEVQAEPAADSVTVRGVTFAPTVEVAGAPLVLRGAGLLRYLRTVPVYVAALYVAPDAATRPPLEDFAKRIEVEYLVSARAEQFNTAGDRLLREVLSAEAYAAMQPQLAQMAGWYPDPKAGDRCALTYVPGIGTELTFNGKPLGVIPGAEFQAVYFQIWLGETPANVPLRDALLQAEAPAKRKRG